MKDAELELENILNSGRKPTYDEVEEALLCVLNKRNALLGINQDLATWLTRLTEAHVQKDAILVKSTLDDLIAERVMFTPQTERRIH